MANQNISLKVKRLAHCKALPSYATQGSAGLDLSAGIESPITIAPGQRTKIPTGIIVEIPLGYEGQVRPRSGLADRAGITLTNCVGTIDSDYRGELQILVVNLGQAPYTFEPGERIAQLIIAPVYIAQVVEVDELSSSAERGAGGFGSTGRITQALQTSVGDANGCR
jgi:dUTP pyrophosphatase